MMIFNLNETEKRTFENYLMWRFQKRTPQKSAQSVPPMEGAIQAALNFFWYHSCNHQPQQQLQLATIDQKTFIYSEDEINNTSTTLYSNQPTSSSLVLNAGDLVKITDNTMPKWTEVETGSGVRGYVSSADVTAVKNNTQIPWKWWFDTLVYGLMPWIAFFPIAIICALIGVNKVTIAPSVFRGEFEFHSNENVSKIRSPFQSLLIGWFLIALLALIPSINAEVWLPPRA